MVKQRVTTAGICLSFDLNAKKSAGDLKKNLKQKNKVECLTLN